MNSTQQMICLIAVGLLKEDVTGALNPEEIARTACDIVEAIRKEVQRRERLEDGAPPSEGALDAN